MGNSDLHAAKIVIDKKNPLYSVMNKHLLQAGKIISTDKAKVFILIIEKGTKLIFITVKIDN